MNDLSNSFYTLPLQIDKVVNGQQSNLCSLQESIAQNLYLLITSGFGELRCDHTFGCSIWEQDFEIFTGIRWKDALSSSLEDTIRIHETRLKDAKVKIEIEEYKILNKSSIRIKKKLNIRIEGFLVKTNEKYEFMDQVFIAPFSIE